MSGIELIAAERKRQIEQEGWTAEHDAQHTFQELARAAVMTVTVDVCSAKIFGEGEEL